ncbi:hypothetical protein HDU99_000882 [Rhizoclosmatium hyalinum]|nr:hypothetical protein HDU99_000882 [Rhizoclosmatium hyalinum]
MAHTAAARAGVENLAKTLSQEWGNQGIRVNCVAPGTILGNGMNNYSDEIRRQTVETHHMNPLGRLGTEAEISAAIVFLLSPASSYITGTTLQVTGGAHLRKGMEDSFIPYSDDCAIPAEFGFDTITRGITGQPGYFQNPIPSGFEGLGGGGLVILKHKSWHVYNEKNRERVRKDEEKAKQEDDEKKGRAVKADQEYRLGVLRSRAGSDKKRSREDSESKEPEFESAGRPGVHLNLFGDLESGKALHRDGSNAEHEQEKAKEKAKFEKQFTMYLGQEVGKDGAPTIPWYAKESSEDKVGVKKLKTELLEDPAAKFISADRSERPHKEGKEVKKDKKKDKSKKHNHTKHEAKSKSMEELRKERMEREAHERKRAEELLKPAPDSMERSRGYNSAFNPELSRRR